MTNDGVVESSLAEARCAAAVPSLPAISALLSTMTSAWRRFADHAAATAYLATTDQALADGLPFFEGERTYSGATTVFLAR